MINIGKVIQQHREAKRMTRPQFAKYLGLGRQHIYKIEVGYSEHKLNTIERIAKKLGLATSELIAQAEKIDAEAKARRIRMMSERAA